VDQNLCIGLYTHPPSNAHGNFGRASEGGGGGGSAMFHRAPLAHCKITIMDMVLPTHLQQCTWAMTFDDDSCSFGVTLHEMMSRKKPFHDMMPYQVRLLLLKHLLRMSYWMVEKSIHLWWNRTDAAHPNQKASCPTSISQPARNNNSTPYFGQEFDLAC